MRILADPDPQHCFNRYQNVRTSILNMLIFYNNNNNLFGIQQVDTLLHWLIAHWLCGNGRQLLRCWPFPFYNNTSYNIYYMIEIIMLYDCIQRYI